MAATRAADQINPNQVRQLQTFFEAFKGLKRISDYAGYAKEDKRFHNFVIGLGGKEFLRSNFWLYWRTMFAFEEWHSALEMKLYLHRFIHQIRGMPDFSTLKFTKYNQYESLVLPLVKWLLDHGVVFHYGPEVTDVDFNIAPGRKQATRVHWRRDGVEGGVDLGPDDLVFYDHRLADRELRQR